MTRGDAARDFRLHVADAMLDALLACEGTGKRPALIEELAPRYEQVGWLALKDGMLWTLEEYKREPGSYEPIEPIYRRIDQSTREDA
jgi:hypothetical protein